MRDSKKCRQQTEYKRGHKGTRGERKRNERWDAEAERERKERERMRERKIKKGVERQTKRKRTEKNKRAKTVPIKDTFSCQAESPLAATAL